MTLTNEGTAFFNTASRWVRVRPTMCACALSLSITAEGLRSYGYFKKALGRESQLPKALWRWKISLVVGHYHGGAALHSGSQYMTILRVIVHSVDQRLVTRDPGVGKMLPHLVNQNMPSFPLAIRCGLEIPNVY